MISERDVSAAIGSTAYGSDGESVGTVAFETGVHGLTATADSVWVLDLHGPRVLDNLRGSTIWRLDPSKLPG